MSRPRPDAQPFAALSLPELEEAGGELVRRIAVALRALGEAGADLVPPDERVSEGAPRRRTARLAALLELAAAALAAAEVTAPGEGDAGRSAQAGAQLEAMATGVMYAAPTIDALLERLEQDRRLLASLARAAEPRLAERHATPLGAIELRALVTEMAVVEPARTAQALERALSDQRAAEHAAAEAKVERD